MSGVAAAAIGGGGAPPPTGAAPPPTPTGAGSGAGAPGGGAVNDYNNGGNSASPSSGGPFSGYNLLLLLLLALLMFPLLALYCVRYVLVPVLHDASSMLSHYWYVPVSDIHDAHTSSGLAAGVPSGTRQAASATSGSTPVAGSGGGYLGYSVLGGEWQRAVRDLGQAGVGGSTAPKAPTIGAAGGGRIHRPYPWE
uniref:Uncharacterized protein n=2 Tax=Oryza sativa subsp. japonica TaxID=39947 RepID=Q10JX5_ORYSJ|nr:hypothetical protein [Oryza sativa Japonica Group]ABF96501.1 hypothetical protein LOC_Os03g29140 [Oryza sativa Japonica Group]